MTQENINIWVLLLILLLNTQKESMTMYGFVSLFLYKKTRLANNHASVSLLSLPPVSVGKETKRKEGDDSGSWINIECECKKSFLLT